MIYRKYGNHRFIQRLPGLGVHIPDHVILREIAPVFQLAFFKQRTFHRIIARIGFIQIDGGYPSGVPSRRSDGEYFCLLVPLEM